MKVISLIGFMFLSHNGIVFSQTFPPGERFEYEARFGLLTLGHMVLEITDTLTVEDEKCYSITSRLCSNPDLKFAFSLFDTFNVITTVKGLLPVVYEKRIHEGKYSSYQKFYFNQESLYVITGDSTKINISQPVMDLLSFWYYLRLNPLVENDTITLYLFEGKREHKIECIVHKKEVIRTPLGRFSTIRITPKTAGKGVFGSSGSMDIWYTDDQKRFPVQIKTKLKFGTITFRLKGVKY
ncbi:MAG: DUF3108 domain-containing protein [candidate division WOR-3 bacterium]|nr:DUF3108 domain-containing protein [candidate division WOR-3 bacterium]